MMNYSPIICLKGEKVEKIRPIRIGKASQESSKVPGLLKFVFDDEAGRDTIEFVWISSVIYCDELFCDSDNYPYPSLADMGPGIYECSGSSYLNRIVRDEMTTGLMFKGHRHFVFWDSSFNWNITCETLLRNGKPIIYEP